MTRKIEPAASEGRDNTDKFAKSALALAVGGGIAGFVLPPLLQHVPAEVQPFLGVLVFLFVAAPLIFSREELHGNRRFLFGMLAPATILIAAVATLSMTFAEAGRRSAPYCSERSCLLRAMNGPPQPFRPCPASRPLA
jgi:peptidoglycan/LPS O-acetylase OafA/YrhL